MLAGLLQIHLYLKFQVFLLILNSNTIHSLPVQFLHLSYKRVPFLW